MRPIAPQTGEVVASPFVAKGYGTHPCVIPCIPPSSRSGERGPHPAIAYRSGDRLGVHPIDGPPPVIRLPSERTLGVRGHPVKRLYTGSRVLVTPERASTCGDDRIRTCEGAQHPLTA